jgi:RimJ/RimL family protein N-acetyltransferase
MSNELIRKEAIAAYNTAFDAVEAGADFLKAIELAAASLYLWRQVGNDQNVAIAYWLYSRALAGAGVGSLAMEAADKSLEHLSKIESPADWLIASLNERLARAYLAAGDMRAEGAIVATAQLIESIEDPDDRALIHGQFVSLLK